HRAWGVSRSHSGSVVEMCSPLRYGSPRPKRRRTSERATRARPPSAPRRSDERPAIGSALPAQPGREPGRSRAAALGRRGVLPQLVALLVELREARVGDHVEPLIEALAQLGRALLALELLGLVVRVRLGIGRAGRLAFDLAFAGIRRAAAQRAIEGLVVDHVDEQEAAGLLVGVAAGLLVLTAVLGALDHHAVLVLRGRG